MTHSLHTLTLFQEAEQKFNTAIYDQIKPPEDLQELNILQIADWNINAVKGKLVGVVAHQSSDGEFLPSTGGLNAIEVQRINHRPQKTHVEFCFEVVPESDPRSAALRGDVAVASPAAVPAKTAVVKKTAVKTVNTYAEELVNFVLHQLDQHDNSEEGRQNLRRVLLAETAVTLNAIQNTSFAAGFKAKE